MRKESFALAIGFLLGACGGETTPPPQTPVAPAPTEPAPAATATAEAPKEEAKPKETLAQLQEKTRQGMIEAMNARDAKKLAGFYAESGVLKVAGAPADATGREAIAQSWQKVFDAFPDLKVGASRVWVKDDVVVVEWAFNGTHQGDLWGIKGTEKKVGAQALDIMWFTPEGQIKEHHVYYDGGTVLSQIGTSNRKVRPIPNVPASPEVFTSNGAAEETKNAEVAKAMATAFENKKQADWLAQMADDVEWDDMTQPETAKGKNDAKKFFEAMTTAFPDVKSSTLGTWTVGDFVITEAEWSGTQKAAFFDIPPTKKSVKVKTAGIMQMKDGKLVKAWTYSNGADLMQQLGLGPKTNGAKKADASAKTAEKK